MATRSSKDKPGAESVASAKEAELQLIEQKVREKEARLREQEHQLRRQCDELACERKRLEAERDELSAREDEITNREREVLKKWSDQSDMTEIHNTLPPSDVAPGMSYMYGVNTPANNAEMRDSMQPIPKVSFREATETVPHFDGYNISLQQFIRACRRARDMVPPSAERNLTKLLMAKLRGRAYCAVEDEPCDSIIQLIDLLTGAFGTPKTIDQYRGELSTIYLRPREHIIDFIGRVKDLRTSILDTERRNKGRLDPRFVSEIDGLTARSFCEGLPLEFREHLKPETRQDYAEAFVAARNFAKRLELDKERYGSRVRETRDRDYYRANPVGPPVAQSTPRRPDYQPRQINQPRADFVRETRTPTYNAYRPETRPRATSPRENYTPRADHREFRASTSVPRRNTSHDTNNKFCRYCKNPGHEIEECRKRQYNNSRKNESGNANVPSGPSGATRMDDQRTRPVNPIEITEAHEVESRS